MGKAGCENRAKSCAEVFVPASYRQTSWAVWSPHFGGYVAGLGDKDTCNIYEPPFCVGTT